MTINDNSINQSLDKALSLLEYFDAENPIRGLSEISRLSSIPKATVYRLLNTFEKNGYLIKIDTGGRQGQYKLGMKFLELGTMVSESIELKEIAFPHMKNLRDDINEDVQLVIRDKNHAIYVEKLISKHPVRLYTKIGRTASLNAGACPRAILSFLKDEEIESIFENTEFIKYTENTIIDKEKLLKLISESRKTGYTISYSEMEMQTIGIGAPIFDYTKNVVGALSTAGPDQRFTPDKFPEIIKKVKETAMKISRELGYKG
ncbi:IclR family transcriptional regulator [uncultured Ilyobacter sp.]|uniref:IclR family transcriptional regulator n=1 Tax=uncultured Ilyobacter sp. TaxID=544433 RepID=UPI0029C6BEA2|nr:IclR family transcriptional regulator [uncultured Ilyobacter sp.]